MRHRQEAPTPTANKRQTMIPINWKARFAAREAEVRRRTLRTPMHLREDDDYAVIASWTKADKKYHRAISPGCTMTVNLIGDYLPDEH